MLNGKELPVLLAQGYLIQVSKGTKSLGRPQGKRPAVRNVFTTIPCACKAMDLLHQVVTLEALYAVR